MPVAPPHTFLVWAEAQFSKEPESRGQDIRSQGSLLVQRPPSPVDTGASLPVGRPLHCKVLPVLCSGSWIRPSRWLLYVAVPGEKRLCLTGVSQSLSCGPVLFPPTGTVHGFRLSIPGRIAISGCGGLCPCPGLLPTPSRPKAISAPGSVRSGFRSLERFRGSCSLRSEPGALTMVPCASHIPP